MINEISIPTRYIHIREVWGEYHGVTLNSGYLNYYPLAEWYVGGPLVMGLLILLKYPDLDWGREWRCRYIRLPWLNSI